MSINMTSVGGAGTHSFRRTNVDTEQDYIYFKYTCDDVIPSTLTVGAGSRVVGLCRQKGNDGENRLRKWC